MAQLLPMLMAEYTCSIWMPFWTDIVCLHRKSTVWCSVFYAKVSFITSPFSAIKVYGSFYDIERLCQHYKNVIEYSWVWIKDLKCTWTSYWQGYASYSLLLAVWLVVHIVELHAVYMFNSKTLATILVHLTSSRLVWAEIKSTVHFALPKHRINEFKPIQQSRA